jgi:superfamily II DNA or RNA helicase
MHKPSRRAPVTLDEEPSVDELLLRESRALQEAPQPSKKPKRPIAEVYTPVVKDFAHQTTAKEKGARKWAFAFFMDQGTGKTKVTLDNACLLYRMKVIRALLVLTMNDVGEQWAQEQIPQHIPRNIRARVAVWHASSSRARRECDELCRPLPDRLHILIVNHEALANDRARKMIVKFLRTFADCTMTAVDESHEFKTPKALRTRFLLNTVRKMSKVRRLLSGTPMDKPFDLYSQMYFLDPDILGFESFVAFKNHYGEYAKEFVMRFDPKKGRKVLHEYPSLQAYVRVDELQRRIEPYVYVVKKEECTDLPPKLYSVKRPPLSIAQQELYAEMKGRGLLLLDKAQKGQRVRIADLGALTEDELADRLLDPKGLVEAQIKLVLSLRLRQIAGGFVTDAEGTVTPIDETANIPRFQSLLTTVQQAHGKSIVWAQYVPELKAIQTMFTAHDMQSVLVYGKTGKKERAEAIDAFKRDPKTLQLVAHERTLGTGMDFPMASTVAYYSNPQSSIRRAQSEDRAHRIGQKGTVNVYDFISCPADALALEALKTKRDVSNAILSLDAAQLKNVL